MIEKLLPAEPPSVKAEEPKLSSEVPVLVSVSVWFGLLVPRGATNWNVLWLTPSFAPGVIGTSSSSLLAAYSLTYM